MSTPEAIFTFEDGMDVQTAQTDVLTAELTFEDGVKLTTAFSGDMTLELVGGIGPMGLQGPPGPAGEPVEITDEEIDEILGIDEEVDDG